LARFFTTIALLFFDNIGKLRKLALRNSSLVKPVTFVTPSVTSNVNLFDETKNKPVIYVDTNRLRRVCVNIISNGLDAMPNGGTLPYPATK